MQRMDVSVGSGVTIGGLLGLVRKGKPEGHAAVFVGFNGCGNVEIGERNSPGLLWSENPQSLADDRVVIHFLPVLIAEDEHRRGHDRCSRFFFVYCVYCGAWRWVRMGVGVTVAVGFFLAQHALLFQILLVHLLSKRQIVVVALIVIRVRIPPPPRIPITCIPPGPSKTSAAGKSKAVVPEAEITESTITVVVTEARTAESIV